MSDTSLYVTKSHYYGLATFSDDLRHEVDGKISYIGVYNGIMYFPATQSFPLSLPKLSIVALLLMPVEVDPKEIELTVHFPGDAEDAPTFKQLYKDFPPRKSVHKDIPDSELRGYFRVPLLYTPALIASPGVIKVRARIGDEVVRIGSLYIKQLEQAAEKDSA